MSVKLVMFAGSRACDQATQQTMESLGKQIDIKKYEIWYGGGDSGLMGVLPKSFHDNGGKVSCVDWTHFYNKFGIPEWMSEDQIEVKDTFPSRQVGLLEKGDKFICLPGGVGTLSELLDVITFNSVKYFDKKPIIIYNYNGYYDHLRMLLDNMIKEGYINDYEHLNVHFVSTTDEILNMIE